MGFFKPNVSTGGSSGSVESVNISHLQPKEDSTLNTASKNIVLAINEVNNKTNNLDREISGLKQTTSTLNNKTSTLEDKTSKLDASVKTLDTNVSSLNTNIDTLKATVREVDVHVKNLVHVLTESEIDIIINNALR